jgi:hypothetical protein
LAAWALLLLLLLLLLLQLTRRGCCRCRWRHRRGARVVR